MIIYRIKKRYNAQHMIEASHGLKENNVYVLINELQMLEMNSFTVLISNIFFKNKQYEKNILCSFFVFSV